MSKNLDDVKVTGQRVLLRADLNVPMQNGAISDLTRLERLAPTITELSSKGAKVIAVSYTHLGARRMADGILLHAPIWERALR